MKCPTCGYIGFETSDRCRNCGYEFALASPAPASPDLALKDTDPGGPLRELDMRPAEPSRHAPRDARGRDGEQPDLQKVLQNLDRVIGGPQATPDLPLFGEDGGPDLPPMVNPSQAPRRPLAVRRTTPDPARLKAPPRPRSGSSAMALELPLPDRVEPTFERATVAKPDDALAAAAPPLRRAMAAGVDFGIIAGIDAVVMSFTLRLCGLTTADLGALPLMPLLGFFVLINGGYFAAFTAAGGQTIGKMAFGLRVVGDQDRPVTPGPAVLRALGCLVSVVSLGIGFVPALLSEGGRALEDRLADTHVIRVPAL
jgi:uncharacterized RDD family membrane protein YckC